MRTIVITSIITIAAGRCGNPRLDTSQRPREGPSLRPPTKTAQLSLMPDPAEKQTDGQEADMEIQQFFLSVHFLIILYPNSETFLGLTFNVS